MEEVPKFCPQHPNWFVKKPKNIDLHSRVLFWTKRRYDRTGQTIICEKCGEPGHLFALCPNPREMRCILCGDFNHNHENCPEAEFNDNIKYNAENCKYCGQPVSLEILSLLTSAIKPEIVAIFWPQETATIVVPQRLQIKKRISSIQNSQ